MDTKWTPGPWRFIEGTGIIAAPDGPDGRSTVHVGDVGAYRDKELLPFNKDRWDADARLVAAAPELYEALEDAMREIDRMKPDPSLVAVALLGRAALAKARGETP